MHECFLWLYTHSSEAQVRLFWEHTGPNLPCVCFFLRFYTICPFLILSISPLEKDSLKTLLWNKQLCAHTGCSRPSPTKAQGELTPEHLYSAGIQRLQIYHAHPGASSVLTHRGSLFAFHYRPSNKTKAFSNS